MRRQKTMILSELISELEKAKQDDYIYFDFCGCVPSGIGSWRGSYEELSISYEKSTEMKVSELLSICKKALGSVFAGYKGGLYKMYESTPVWVDNSGESTETAILDLIETNAGIIIETGYREF